MPTPESAGVVWEVVMEGRQEGQQVLNVWHFRTRTSVDDMELRVLRACIDCLLTTLRPVLGSNYQFVKARGKRVAPDVGPIVEVLPAANEDIQGDSEGDTLPTFASLCVNIHTTRGGRSGRGKFFLPGIPEGATSGSYIETTNPYWVAVAAFLACLAGKFIKANEPLGTNDVEIGVMSRKIGGVKPPYLLTGFAPATGFKPRNIVGTTNSRKVGRGS